MPRSVQESHTKTKTKENHSIPEKLLPTITVVQDTLYVQADDGFFACKHCKITFEINKLAMDRIYINP